MTSLKTIILCADDFGLNSAVSQGIIQLGALRRLSAVSCMVNGAVFTSFAPDLLALKEPVQMGLHFNLTEGHFLSQPEKPCFGLKEVLIKSHAGFIQPSFITAEFNAQLDLYIKIMGRLPDFIDGHQHVHQFPGIRQVIAILYEQRLRAKGVSIRSTYPTLSPPKYQFKAGVLAATGGKALARSLKKLAIAHNDYFSGVYDFAPQTNYRNLFRQWLNIAQAQTLFMCHPAVAKEDNDAIADARVGEFAYFSSAEFVDDCREFAVKLI